MSWWSGDLSPPIGCSRQRSNVGEKTDRENTLGDRGHVSGEASLLRQWEPLRAVGAENAEDSGAKHSACLNVSHLGLFWFYY